MLILNNTDGIMKLNNFQQLEAEFEALLPEDLMFQIERQINNIKHLIEVVETFLARLWELIQQFFQEHFGPRQWLNEQYIPIVEPVDWRQRPALPVSLN